MEATAFMLAVSNAEGTYYGYAKLRLLAQAEAEDYEGLRARPMSSRPSSPR